MAPSGDLSAVPLLSETPHTLTAFASLALDQRSYAFGADRQTSGLLVWRLQDGRAVTVSHPSETGVFAGNAVHALATATLQGQGYVLALSQIEDRVVSFRLSAAGTLQLTDVMDPVHGFHVDSPMHMEVVQLRGQTYVVLGSSGSSSISVLSLSGDGSLRVLDQINDDLHTRFSGVSAMTTVVSGDQVYIAAAGRDDGLTLLTLLPGGRLVHLATLEDDLDMALADPVALSMLPQADRLDIAVAGEQVATLSESGLAVSWVQASLGDVGMTVQQDNGGGRGVGTNARDQIIGGAGADDLRGFAGDDIMQDGAGQDTLSGGLGADLFVLSADGQPDRIVDFEPGIDRLDLSLWGRFYRTEDIEIQFISGGAELRFRDEVLVVHSQSGAALDAADFPISQLRDLWHIDVTPQPAAAQQILGDAADNLLEGADGDDQLSGAGGNDLLRGQDGNDWLNGEATQPAYDAGYASLYRLYQASLGRAPDLPGLFDWAASLRSGQMGLAQVADGFVASREFAIRYGATTDAEFVALLYQNVLGREAATSELDYWGQLLSSGARQRAEVVVGFAESTEFIHDSQLGAAAYTVSQLQASFSDEIFRLYQATLGRDPDLAGFLDWTGQLATGRPVTTVIEGFTRSVEYTSRYGATSEEAFLDLLYRNILGRGPDPVGLAYWLEQLAGGMTRAGVVQGFSDSPEFIREAAADVKRWMQAQGVNDQLIGGAGQDVLQGGVLSDVFVFSADAPGQNIVMDLEPWDRLRFEGFEQETAQSLLSQFSAQGDAVIFADQDVTVTFLNTALSDVVVDMIDLFM